MPLNQNQLEAVAHESGPLLILAGAGSGKTRVLVHRIARLIAEHKAEPWQILAVTFTNKAARELVERCRSLVGPAATDVWVGTFHGIGARLLRRHAEALDYGARFAIYDSDDQLRLIKEIVGERNLSPTLFRADAVRSAIDEAKNEALSPQQLAERHPEAFFETVAELYAAYQGRLHDANAMDFGDLIVNLLNLFEKYPDILDSYQHKFRHILVDEYQDTNHAQYLVVSRLAARHGNLCVVGDDDQSIYGWRGANIRNILEFDNDFPDARVVCLNVNYRSTANIIDAAHAVVCNNQGRREKRMRAAQEAGAKVRVYTAGDEKGEARYVVDAIRDHPAERTAAVFYRTHAQSRAVEEALGRRSVRYTMVGGVKFYDRKEIRDIVAYLRFLANPDDALALGRIINVPARHIGRTTWEKIVRHAATRGCSAWQAIDTKQDISDLRAAARTRLGRFRALVGPWFALVGGTVTTLLERVIDDTAYIDYLRALPSGDGDSRAENVKELLTAGHDFDENFDARELDDDDADLGALGTFLEQIALQADVDSYDGDDHVVTLMTVHNSKGLEFDRVFMIGMEEGLFPHARSVDESGIEEERRLAYVGMTRAKQELFLLRARRRRLYGTTQRNLPSRFLEELPEELVEREYAQGEAQSFATPFLRPNADSAGSHAGNAGSAYPTRTHRSTGTYKVGMKVAHPLFGVGTIRRADGSGDQEKIVVQFPRVGVKKLVARYAKLQVV